MFRVSLHIDAFTFIAHALKRHADNFYNAPKNVKATTPTAAVGLRRSRRTRDVSHDVPISPRAAAFDTVYVGVQHTTATHVSRLVIQRLLAHSCSSNDETVTQLVFQRNTERR